MEKKELEEKVIELEKQVKDLQVKKCDICHKEPIVFWEDGLFIPYREVCIGCYYGY